MSVPRYDRVTVRTEGLSTWLSAPAEDLTVAEMEALAARVWANASEEIAAALEREIVGLQ